MGDDDLIRRGDVMAAYEAATDAYNDGRSGRLFRHHLADAIAALPAVTVDALTALYLMRDVLPPADLDEPIEGDVGLEPQPAPDADDSYPYDAIEQCERDLDGAEDEPFVNEKLRTMHQEYLRAIAEGRLVTDAVSPTDARLRAATAQLDAGATLAEFTKTLTDAAAVATKAREAALREAAERLDDSMTIAGAKRVILALIQKEKPHD